MNLAAATASRVAMPALGVVRDHLHSAIATRGADIDRSAIARAVRDGRRLFRREGSSSFLKERTKELCP